MKDFEEILKKFNIVLNSEDYQHRLNLMGSFAQDIQNLVRTPVELFEQLLAALERDYSKAERSEANTKKIAEKLGLPEFFVDLIETVGDMNFQHSTSILRAWIEAYPELKKVFKKHVKDEEFFAAANETHTSTTGRA